MESFPGLRPGEQVIFFVRKHWMAYVRVFLKLLLNLVVMSLLAYFIVAKFPHDSITYFILVEGLLFYLLGIWWFTFNGWLDEELDAFIITNERIIDTTQSAFLSIEIASADLDHVEDVRGKVSGFAGGLLHVGNIEVQTAGSEVLFFMNYIKSPERYIDQIIELKDAFVARRGTR
ncbi:MAG: hypothetical protein V1936_01990 [Patescibacteria group bacterium]